VVNNKTESMLVKDGVAEGLNFGETFGFGVRVLADGAWGFASSRELTESEIDRVTSLALEIARASALASGENVDLGPPVTSQGEYRTPVAIDPFSLTMEEKLGVLLSADSEMAKVKGLRTRRGNLTFIQEHKWFAGHRWLGSRAGVGPTGKCRADRQ
jgi:TldD protein